MKKKSLFIALIIALITTLILSGCGGNAGSGTEGAGSASEMPSPTIEAQTIAEHNNIKIEAIKMYFDKDLNDYAIECRVENKNSSPYVVTVNDGVVDGYYLGLMGILFHVEIGANSTEEKVMMYIDGDMLERSGLKSVGKISFVPVIREPDVYDSKPLDRVTIETSNSGKVESGKAPEGKEVLNKDGFKIVALGEFAGYIGKEFGLYIENNGERDATLTLKDNKINLNGKEASTVFIEDVPAGTKYYASIVLIDTDLKNLTEDKVTSLKSAFVISEKGYDGQVFLETEELELAE